MGNALALEWIRTLGFLIISWPVVGFIAVIILRKPLTTIIRQFSEGNITRAKLGPLEIERQIEGIKSTLQVQQVEQQKQKSEIDSLRFLIGNFVTEAELKHLEKLAANRPFPFDKAPYFEVELRRLRSLGLIRNFADKSISGMPQQGNLQDYFAITDRGREYLELRRNG